MGKKIFMLIAAFSLLASSISCIKKEQKVSESGEVIKLLNSSKGDEALVKVDTLLGNDPGNEELLYLKASALSMSAGIDVYKLFPILKMKIFDIAIGQWGEQREFEKKMRNRRNMGKDDEITKTDIKNGKYRERKNEKESIYVPPKDDEIKFSIEDLSAWRIKYNEASEMKYFVKLTYKTNVVLSKNEWIYHNLELNEKAEIFRILTTEENEVMTIQKDISMDNPILRKFMLKIILEQHKVNWYGREDKKHKNERDLKMIQSLLAVVDMVPLVKTIPKIDQSNFRKLEEAQGILFNLQLKNFQIKNEIYQKSRKQVMMISALKLISRIQTGVDLEKINNPTDLYCAVNDGMAEQLVDGRKDALLILNGIKDSAIREKNKEFFVDIEERLAKFDQEVAKDPIKREEAIALIQKSIDLAQSTNCNTDIRIEKVEEIENFFKKKELVEVLEETL